MRRYLPDASDTIFTLGLLLATAGAYFVWPPAALLLPGVVLMWLGSLMARRGGK